MKKVIAFISALILLAGLSTAAFAAGGTVHVVINGEQVAFTEASGFPYIDENQRTMVPLRATMEKAGASVGYDPAAATAIVIRDNTRIEVPIGADYLYCNNQKIQNDTSAVVKNGRTYLPIRAVLEAARFTVEWSGETRSVIAYNFDYDSNDLVPYHTGDLATLVSNVLAGNVVYLQGQYYATPEYWKRMSNTVTHYLGDDLNTAIYPQENRADAVDFTEVDISWISGVLFDKKLVYEEELPSDAVAESSEIPGYDTVYGFFDERDNSKLLYLVDEMTDEFMAAENAEGTFNGIHMKKEGGTLWFDYQDLVALGIYSL